MDKSNCFKRIRFAPLLWGCLMVGALAGGCGSQQPDSRKIPTIGPKEQDSQETEGARSMGPQRPVSVSGSFKHTVMVMDEGFDLTHQVFAGKVLDSYSWKCSENGGIQEPDWDGMSFAAKKSFLIASYENPAESLCTAEQGIDFEPAADLLALAGKREQWNEAILGKQGVSDAAEAVEMLGILSGESSQRIYHGTAVAGTIAYDNPGVRLILLQLGLKSPTFDNSETTSACPDQKFFDEWVRLHEDNEVERAFVQGGLSDFERELDLIIRQHGVSLINFSAGSLPRELQERFIQEIGCPAVDLAGYFTISGRLSQKRRTYLRESLGAESFPLFVQAAGNEALRIDGYADALDCHDRTNSLILVGSYNYSQKLSEFSNFGDCVDYFALGSGVIVAAPADFVSIADGTSFSAPMLARHITQSYNAESAPGEILRALDDTLDTRRFLPTSSFPSELAWDSSAIVSSFSLRSGALSGIQRLWAPRRVLSRFPALGRLP